MADSLDEEHDPQPSISKNANILQSSGTQTAERRRQGNESSPFLGEKDSEDETEAPPQQTFRQTAGLRERSRTELRSSNQRRTAPGGNRLSSFKNAERAHHQRSVYGNNEDIGVRKAAGEDSRQVDRDTRSNTSHTNNSETGRRISEAPRNGRIKLEKPAPKHNKPGNWRGDSVIIEKQGGDTPSTSSIPAAPDLFVNPLDDNRRERFPTAWLLEDGPDSVLCKHCKRHILKTAIKEHLIICTDNSDFPSTYDFNAFESSYGEVSPVRGTSQTRAPGIAYLPGASASSNIPDGAVSEVSALLLKLGSIGNHTFSRDKTQGEEACNSELLAAFGRKIQAHCFGGLSNQPVNLAVHQLVPPETSTLVTDNGSLATPPPHHPRPSNSFPMSVSGSPSFVSLDAVKTFARQSNVEFISTVLSSIAHGMAFVEFKTAVDRKVAVAKLNGREFRGGIVRCFAIPPSPQAPGIRTRTVPGVAVNNAS